MPLRRIDPTCPVQLLIGRATTNLASGIHHEAYDCDNHNEAAEYAAKLEAGLLPSNIDHLVSAVEQRAWNGKSFRPHHICKPTCCARGNGNGPCRLALRDFILGSAPPLQAAVGRIRRSVIAFA